jgi:hypothetical protein
MDNHYIGKSGKADLFLTSGYYISKTECKETGNVLHVTQKYGDKLVGRILTTNAGQAIRMEGHFSYTHVDTAGNETYDEIRTEMPIKE